MLHLDLFSGVGGFSLAAQRVFPNHRVVGFCESEPFCQQVLRKHWPGVPIHDDIRDLDGRSIESVELVTGGFPCQPYSVAGVQRGAEDDRALWPEMRRVIAETRPRWVIAENVFGFIEMGLDGALLDLERQGYDVGTVILPACAIDAAHRRDRVWIVANADGERRREEGPNTEGQRSARESGRCGLTSTFSDAHGERRQQSPLTPFAVEQILARESIDARNGEGGGGRSLPEPRVVREVYGLPHRMDRHRIIALGNAIVPQVAEELFRFIREIDYEV